ncbi:MAG TPA: hypothetical protein DCY94_03110 [Firmicutes bacterium]|nr:hypothetical protein [Bacillota bacterium]
MYFLKCYYIELTMKKIAHRGYTTSYIKENTIEAFTNAINNGFEGIECDVRESKDKRLVICHDASIERTSNGVGMIRNMTLNELETYNFGSKEVPSKIPLLSDVLKKYKGTMKIIELKSRIDLTSILDLIDDDTYFMSFDTSYMFELKKKHPNLKCGVLNYGLNGEKDYDLDMICILDFVATDSIVMKFLSRGIKVFIYGIVGKINYVRDYENLYYIANHLN